MSEKESRVESRESSVDGSSEAAYKAPRWAWWVATGFGSGYLKPAPGTWGSLAAVAVWCGLMLGVYRISHQLLKAWVQAGPRYFIAVLFIPQIIALGLALGMTWLAIRCSELVVRETAVKDPSYIVADEWAGMWWALLPVCSNFLVYGMSGHASTTIIVFGLDRSVFLALLLGFPFLAFRVLDIWKPWPCYQVQELPGGHGVVADDLVAGLYALALTYLWTQLMNMLFIGN